MVKMNQSLVSDRSLVTGRIGPDKGVNVLKFVHMLQEDNNLMPQRTSSQSNRTGEILDRTDKILTWIMDDSVEMAKLRVDYLSARGGIYAEIFKLNGDIERAIKRGREIIAEIESLDNTYRERIVEEEDKPFSY